VLFTGTVYKNVDGKISKIVLIALEINEQKRIAKERNEPKELADLAQEVAGKAKSTAEIAVQAKQQFLSNISHEIRTPINAIIAFIKVVLKTELTAKQL